MPKSARIYVAGHCGLAGSAILRRLQAQGYRNLIVRTHAELDLTDEPMVQRFFKEQKPEYVFLAAAKVGGIMAHCAAPSDFISINLRIQNNVLGAALSGEIERLLFLGSSCIYPRECPQPMREEYLLTGALEPTNRPYALAKIVGVEMCWAYNRQFGAKFLAAMPTNLFGPRDNYDLNNSHVVPALIRKMHTAKIVGAKEVVLWGSGTPRREFLYSEDMAEACVFLMNLPDETFLPLVRNENEPPLVNVGWGKDITILELAELISDVVGFRGNLVFDTSKPDGTPRKLLDVSRMQRLGWSPRTPLRAALEATYKAFQQEHKELMACV